MNPRVERELHSAATEFGLTLVAEGGGVDDIDPLCALCGLRRHSDCVCVEPRYRPGPLEFERQMRSLQGPSRDAQLREARRLAAPMARGTGSAA